MRSDDAPASSEETGRLYGGHSAEERRAQRRHRLLAAALEAFGTRGYASTTITSLCAAANVATRTFYEEFGSLESVLVTLLDESRRGVADTVTATLAGLGDAPIARRIDVGVRSYLGALTADPRRTRILLVETAAVSPTVDAHRGRMFQQFVGLIETEADRARANGLIPERDYHLTSIAVVGMLSTMVTLWATERGLGASIDEIGDEAIRLVQLAFSGS